MWKAEKWKWKLLFNKFIITRNIIPSNPLNCKSRLYYNWLNYEFVLKTKCCNKNNKIGLTFIVYNIIYLKSQKKFSSLNLIKSSKEFVWQQKEICKLVSTLLMLQSSKRFHIHTLSLLRPGMHATRTKCVPFIFIFDKAKIFHFIKHQIANGGRDECLGLCECMWMCKNVCVCQLHAVA